jgi:hypothetical protein
LLSLLRVLQIAGFSCSVNDILKVDMSANRTVFWLALITAFIPFLAVPDWVIQTAVVVLALGIVIITRATSFQSHGQAFQPPQIDAKNEDGPQESDNKDSVKEQPTGSEKNTQSQDKEGPVDITDPDADTMVASGQWRRRSSRNLSDDSA